MKRIQTATKTNIVIDLDEQTQEFLSGGDAEARLKHLRPLGKQLVHPQDSVL